MGLSQNEVEAVWDLAEDRSIYIVKRPEGAGRSLVTTGLSARSAVGQGGR